MFPKALIIDDVCESHGCTNQANVKRGANSLGATFSFYFGHHMSTIEGGMISTNNSNLYDLMKMKRSHGFARESLISNVHAELWPQIDRQFLFMTDGYNFRNHEICAVLGLSQLKRLDSMIKKRNQNYKRFVATINSRPDLFYPVKFYQSASSFCLPFMCYEKDTMQELKKVFNKNQIEYRPIVSGNLLRQPFLKNYRLEKSQRKTFNVDIVHDNGVYIGNNHFVNNNDMDFLEDIIKGLN
jgi:CDP-6-deoxy-D-xylo-4-hexulose-3-dehydrase